MHLRFTHRHRNKVIRWTLTIFSDVPEFLIKKNSRRNNEVFNVAIENWIEPQTAGIDRNL